MVSAERRYAQQRVPTRANVWVGASLWTIAGVASAQAANTETATANGGDTTEGLEEIIVTAQRRPEDVQHAALAIDVVSAQALGLSGAEIGRAHV